MGEMNAVEGSSASAPMPAGSEGEAVTRADTDGSLSAADVVRLVREASPDGLIERESVRRALERSYQRRAALLPQLSGRSSQTRTQLGTGFSGQPLQAPPFNTFQIGVEGTQTVFDAELYADFRVARLAHAIAQLDYEAAIQDLLEQALMLYYTQLRDQRQIEIIEGNIERERRLLNLAEEQFEAGTAVKIDVTRAEVRLARERRALLVARTEAADSLFQLQALLGLGMEKPISVESSVSETADEPAPPDQMESMRALADLRPELEGRRREVDQAALARKAAGWQRLPSIELFANWGYESGEAFDGAESEAWLLGVRLDIPIFEGARISAEKREADAALRQTRQVLRRLRLRVEREFKFAIVSMNSRFEQIGIAREEVRLGREEVNQARERYREGLADNRELIDAQQRLADAQDSLLEATYLYRLSRLSFARAIGDTERVLER